MWKASAADKAGFFCFERSISGTTGSAPIYAYTGTNAVYTTYIKGYSATTAQITFYLAGSLTTAVRLTWIKGIGQGSSLSEQSNNSVPVNPIFPSIGYLGNPMTVWGSMNIADGVENSTVQIVTYGKTTTYLMSKTFGPFIYAAGGNANNTACLRWD